MSSPFHFRGRRPDQDLSIVDGEYGVERRLETFVTSEMISKSVQNQGSRYALKTTVDSQDGWSYTQAQVSDLVDQYCRISEMNQYATLNDALQVRTEQLSGTKPSTPAGPYHSPDFSSGSTESSSPTGGIKLTEFTIPDPGFEYRVLCFGQVEQKANPNLIDTVFGNSGLFAKAGMISVYGNLRQVGVGLGTSYAIYAGVPIVPTYSEVSSPMTGPLTINVYAYVTPFGTGGTSFTSHEGYLTVYLLPD